MGTSVPYLYKMECNRLTGLTNQLTGSVGQDTCSGCCWGNTKWGSESLYHPSTSANRKRRRDHLQPGFRINRGTVSSCAFEGPYRDSYGLYLYSNKDLFYFFTPLSPLWTYTSSKTNFLTVWTCLWSQGSIRLNKRPPHPEMLFMFWPVFNLVLMM